MRRRLGIRRGTRSTGLTLRGERGRPLRILLVSVLALAAAFALFNYLKPEKQLKSAAEVKRITDKGILTVGIRNDIPGFSLNG